MFGIFLRPIYWQVWLAIVMMLVTIALILAEFWIGSIVTLSIAIIISLGVFGLHRDDPEEKDRRRARVMGYVGLALIVAIPIPVSLAI